MDCLSGAEPGPKSDVGMGRIRVAQAFTDRPCLLQFGHSSGTTLQG